MNDMTEITAELIETTFGSNGVSSRFVSFCNAVISSASSFPLPSFPIVSEKPGADGGFDAEWQIPINANNFNSPFAEIGWNTFQFKARGISGNGRSKTIAALQSNLSEALKQLVTRLEIPAQPKRYVLFTNLQLGLRTKSKTANKSVLSRDRSKLESAIRKGSSGETRIEIIDAAQLATLVNQDQGLRLTYFEPSTAKTWHDKWQQEQSTKSYKGSEVLIGREKELQELTSWIADTSIRVIAICGPSGMGKTRLALEATKDQGEKFRTTIIEDVDRFECWPLNSFKNNGPVRIFIVEDPSEEQALRLAKQAVVASSVKIIFTFPSEQNAPQLKLTTHESVRQSNLGPLSSEASKQLLKSCSCLH